MKIKPNYKKYYKEGYNFGRTECGGIFANPYPLIDKNWSEEGSEKHYHWASGYYKALDELDEEDKIICQKERDEEQKIEAIQNAKSAKQRKAEIQGQSSMF